VADGARRLSRTRQASGPTAISSTCITPGRGPRLRSNLSTFKRLVDDDWRQTIRAELAWIGSLLGEVRDADVLSVWLEPQAADLDPADRSGLLALLVSLADERRLALGALLEGLDGARYAA